MIFSPEGYPSLSRFQTVRSALPVHGRFFSPISRVTSKRLTHKQFALKRPSSVTNFQDNIIILPAAGCTVSGTNQTR